MSTSKIHTGHRVLRSDLTGRIYVITRWRYQTGGEEGSDLMVSEEKYDVTGDVRALLAEAYWAGVHAAHENEPEALIELPRGYDPALA